METLNKVEESIRHVLFMYRDIIESYRGFGHGIDTGLGRFDAPALINLPETLSPDDPIRPEDLELLRIGAAIALLCDVSDAWDETGHAAEEDGSRLKAARDALRNGKLDAFPDIAKAFELGFGPDETAFREQLAVVYQRHIIGYFAQLIGNVRGR
jgi:hypothetical protein